MSNRLARYFLCSIILASTSAFAITGEELAELCGVEPGTRTDDVGCYFYALGVVEGMHWERVLRADMQPVFCPGEHATPPQVLPALKTYLQSRGTWHADGPVLVKYALANAFPCK